MILSIVKKSKQKSDKSSKLYKLQNITTEMKEAVLTRYFTKCKMKHAAGFFEEKRLKHEALKHIESIEEIQLKEVIATNYESSYRQAT